MINSSVKIKIISLSVLVVLTAFASWYFHWEDVHTYYNAGISLLKGRVDLYSPDFADSQVMDYRYPPFFLFVFAPLSLLSYGTVKFIWLWLNILTGFFATRAIWRGYEIITKKQMRLALVLALSFAVSAKYFFMLFQHFNAHLLILGLVFGSFYLVLKNRPLPAAAMMAAAITFKLVPVLLLPYFVLKKQWKFLAATVICIIVFNLLPALHFGASLNTRILNDWYNHVMVNNEFHETNGPINISLKGQLERVLTEIDYSKRETDTEYENVNIANLNKSQTELIWKISGFLIFAATGFFIWYCARLRGKNKQIFSDFDSLAYYEFGLMVCLMLIVAPRSNGYYFTALFFPLVPLIYTILQKKSKINIAAIGLIILATIILPLYPGRLAQRYLLVFGIDFYAAFILWFALAYNLIRESSTAKFNLE